MTPEPTPIEPTGDASAPRQASRRTRRSSLSAAEPPVVRGYEVGEVIGRGAMGIVYRARQMIVDREVALKVLHPEHSSQERLILRLKREARMTARLAHPHVVSAIDMGETATGSWWYAMEFVDGPSLALRLRQEGRLKEREALRLFIPLVEALEHLYEHGVVHRDVKPGNILIDRAGGARLADLGLAFSDDDPKVSGSGGTLGTPHYISPEQAVDSGSADVRSDIWSLGATLYHTVCGRPPFRGESAAEILSAVLYMRVEDPRALEPSLSKGLALVLRKCLTHEPVNRYQTPRELLLDLERVRERRAPRVHRRVLDPVQRSQRVQSGVLIVAAAVLVVAIGYFAFADPLGFQTQDLPDGAIAAHVPHTELEGLLERATNDPENLAQHIEDLASLRETLAPAYEGRADEVERELARLLRDIVRGVQDDTLAAVETALRARDFQTAHSAFHSGLPALMFERCGYTPDQLEATGTSIGPWMEKQVQRLEQSLIAATTQLQDALGEWNGRVRDEADRFLDVGDWRRALALLDQTPESILREAGHADVRLPPSYLAEAVEFGAKTTLFLKLEEVKQEWRALDKELTDRVITRAQTLRDELELGHPRVRGAEMLVDWFELELEQRGLTREKMPLGMTGVAVACLDILERRANELGQREQALLEDDARIDVAETAQFSEPLWRGRRYEEVRELWAEAVGRMRSLAGRGDESWRAPLEALVERRRVEAEMLVELLRTAADRVRDLNGERVPEVTVGAIRYPNRRISSGPDPLREGFALEGMIDRVDLRALPFQQLADFAGLTALEELTAEQRLAFAAFALHDNRLEDARVALRPDLFLDGPLAALETDLEGRVFDSIEGKKRVLESRVEEARGHLALVFDRDRQGRSRSNVIVRINRLIDDYSDIPDVRDRLVELRSLRDELRARPTRTVEERLRTDYGPTSLAFPRLGRVELDFAFQSKNVGSWQHGDWRFDGAGWLNGHETHGWASFAEQRSPRLILTEPLDASKFDLRVEFDEYEGPPQLVVVSIAGFHVALAGPGLPGSGQRSRVLAGTGDFDDFLAGLRKGEGTVVPSLLRSNESHVLELSGYRAGGRLSVVFDGRVLEEVRRRVPADPNVSVDIRAWEPIRLRRVRLELAVGD